MSRLPSNRQISQPFPSSSSQQLQEEQSRAYYAQQGSTSNPASPPRRPQPPVEPSDSPRRPTRSVRRPNGTNVEGAYQIPPDQPRGLPSHPQMQQRPMRPSAPVRQQSRDEWDQDREERAQQRAAAQPSDDTAAYKMANVGQAFKQVARPAEQQRKVKEYEPPPDRRNGNERSGREREQDVDLEKEGFGDTGDGTDFRQVDAVLRKIKVDWPTFLDPNFIPVTEALSLISSSQRTFDAFTATKFALEDSLKSTLSTHFSSFASSIATHNSFQQSLAVAQGEVASARGKLEDAKRALTGKRSDLGALYSRQETLKGMMKLLDAIEHLKGIPDQLETLITEKKLLHASLLLIRSIRTINKPAMLEIGALGDLRAYLLNQEIMLRDILMEELHNHLYLKSFYCEGLWSPYVKGQSDLPRTTLPSDQEIAPNSTSPSAPAFALPLKASRLSAYLASLAMRPSQDPLMSLPDDSDFPTIQPPTHGRGTSNGTTSIASFSSIRGIDGQTAKEVVNPESDSFGYIEQLLEGLAALGKVAWGLDVVSQRLPGEVSALVESTIHEVEERAIERRRNFSSDRLVSRAPGRERKGSVDVSLTISSKAGARTITPANVDPEQHSETLKDMFWTLFSKLDAVLQAHRVVLEVSTRISGRKDFRDLSKTKPGAGSAGSVMEIWRPIQAEVRTLLHDYLTDNESASIAARNPIPSINDVLRDGRQPRDRNRQYFRFGDSDAKTLSRLLKKQDDDLNRALRAAVPGLVVHHADVAQVTGSLSSLIIDERTGVGGGGSSHRTVVPPDAFNVSVLFEPTLAFLRRVKEDMPGGFEDSSGSFDSFLDEFVVKVYLPQLEARVTSLFQEAVGSSDSFLESSGWELLSHRPLVKCSTQVLTLINNLCAMLRTTPFHREDYSRLIISVIVQFYQRCSTFFKDLVSRDLPSTGSEEQPHLCLSSLWAQRTELTACVTELLRTDEGNIPQMRKLSRQETRIEAGLKGDSTVDEKDLLSSTRRFGSLGNLYHSLTWFMIQLSALKTTSEEPMSPAAVELPERPMSLESNNSLADQQSLVPLRPSKTAELPLTKAMSQRFDALLLTYEQLAQMVLYTMRLEIRCRFIHFMDLAMRQGNYRIEQEAFEPDPNIIDLISDLSRFEEIALASLPAREQRFVFRGLGSLADDLLVTSSRYIRFLNAFGLRKIMRNILALQQSLKMVLDDPTEADFDRGRSYWEMYEQGSRAMLDELRQSRPLFTFDEYKSMLQLQNGIDQVTREPGAPAAIEAGRKSFDEYLIELHSVLALEDW